MSNGRPLWQKPFHDGCAVPVAGAVNAHGARPVGAMVGWSCRTRKILIEATVVSDLHVNVTR